MSLEPESVEISYDTQFADYLTLYRLALARRYRRQRWAVWALAVAGIAVGSAGAALGSWPSLGAALVAAVLLGSWLDAPRRLARRRWRRGGSVRHEVRLDASGYRGSSAGVSTAMQWSAVLEVTRTPGHLYLGAHEVSAVIALRALPPPWTADTLHAQCLRWLGAAAPE